jgi:DNA-binding IclR family transcriptional regulator
MSDRPPSAYAYYARHTVQALRLIAETPRSTTELEEHLQVGGNAARRLIGRLLDDGLVEEHPDSNLQHPRYRIAAGGYDFGLVLVALGPRELAELIKIREGRAPLPGTLGPRRHHRT